jgi:3-oxoacyl-[acyl-carrier protein] reductase
MEMRTVVVSGANGELGRQLTRDLAKSGLTVITLSRHLEEPEGTSRHFVVNTSNALELKNIFSRVAKEGVRIDYAFVLEAIFKPQLFVSRPLADVHEEIQNNLFGPINLVHALLGQMIHAKQGRIFLASSIAAVHPVAGQAPYAISKAGLEALAIASSVEVMSRNVVVHAVRLGAFNGGLMKKLSQSEQQKVIAALARSSLPSIEETAARLVQLVTSDSSSYNVIIDLTAAAV